MTKTTDSVTKIIGGLSVSELAVLLTNVTDIADEDVLCLSAHARGQRTLPYFNVHLWVADDQLHMHDGRTHYMKDLSDALKLLELPAIQWIHENCYLEPYYVEGPAMKVGAIILGGRETIWAIRDRRRDGEMVAASFISAEHARDIAACMNKEES